MLFHFIFFNLFLINFSSSIICPVSNYCSCSSNLEIINCSNQRFTNEILLKLNNHLPRSTVVLNISSNFLTSIKSLTNLSSLQILDLSSNNIDDLPTDFFVKYPSLKILSLKKNSFKSIPANFINVSHVDIDISNNEFHCTCQYKLFKTKNFFRSIICQNKKIFNEDEFCSNDETIEINPKQSITYYENDPITLNCSSKSKHYWTLNKTFYPPTIQTSSYSTIIIQNLRQNHSGIWTCHNQNFNRSIYLTILKTSSSYFCQSIHMNTSKGYFYWPRTIINHTIEKICPYGPAAWLKSSNENARAWYTCSSNGQWIHFDISQCAFQTNISRIFDHLALNQTNLLSRLVRFVSKIDQTHMKLNDIILLIDLIDEQQVKSKEQDKIMLIFHLTDFILQLRYDTTYINEYQAAMTRLRLIIERLLDFTNQSWLYIGKQLTSMTIQTSSLSKLCYIPNRSLLAIICQIDHYYHKSRLLSMDFPSTPNTTNQYSVFRIIFYRNSNLFDLSLTQDKHKPVIYIRPAIQNHVSVVKITFYDELSQGAIMLWDRNQTSWQMKSSVCKIIEYNTNSFSTNCVLFYDNSLSITYFNKIYKDKTKFFHETYPRIVICMSSVLASVCLLCSIIFYINFSKICQISRFAFHCLINYWFNLAILLLIFAFGMRLYEYTALCQLIAISIHYICLTIIIWLIFLTYATWKRTYLKPIRKENADKSLLMIMDSKNNDDGSDNAHRVLKTELKSRYIIQLYVLVYGIALIICSAHLILTNDVYISDNICFFNNFQSILVLVIPMLILILLLLIFLLFAHNYVKYLTKKTNNLYRSASETRKIDEKKHSKDEDDGDGEQMYSKNKCDQFATKDISNQHKSINQLLSILSQLILLIFVFLSSVAIYLHPLNRFKIRYEHMIYCHFYGFFVLFLSFYILSFYLLSQFNLIRNHYLSRKKVRRLSTKSVSKMPPLSTSTAKRKYSLNKREDAQSLTEGTSAQQPIHSHYSSNIHVSSTIHNPEQTIINDENEHTSNRQKSKYYNCSYQMLHTTKKMNLSENRLNDRLPCSSCDRLAYRHTSTQGFQEKLLYDQISKVSLSNRKEYFTLPNENAQMNSSFLNPCQSFTQSRTLASRAIIRSLPTIRFSLKESNTIMLKQTYDKPYHKTSSSSSSSVEEQPVYFNETKDYAENDELFVNKPYDYAQVVYIDEDDMCNVSIKSSITLSTGKERSRTFSYSSSNESNNVPYNKNIGIHETTV